MEQRRPSRTTDSDHGDNDATPSNVFADDCEVDIAPADGFGDRSDAASILSFTPSEPSSARIHTASAYVASHPHMTMASLSREPSRSSIQKSQSQQNPFASAEDDDSNDDTETPLARSPSVLSQSFAPGIARRSTSSASSRQFAASGSSRLGASGPSHPYTMYPQGTIARTASAATSAAVGRTRGSLSSRTGPTHPYGMYTQNISHSDYDDDDDEDGPSSSVQNPVPVGFGLGQTYRRVRGPEGEEQDIIGEYGHAEQLPPYTQYADDGPVKAPLIAEPEALHSRSPVAGSDPAMPLMHQRMSQRQSMTDASQLEQNTPLLADSASSTEASTTGKKSWREKTWKEKKQTRICGVRFSFCLILLAVVAVIFAALVGTLVGYLAGSKHSKNAASNSSYYDASIIPTPTNSMPSGTYALSLSTPEATQADCVVDQRYRAAWDCRLGGKPAVAISVGLPPSPSPTMGAFLFYASGDTNITYGAQYQSLNTQFSNFIPVRDNDNSTLGPAFYFSQTYNKVVVVPESALSPPPARAKRWWAKSQPHKAVEWNADWSSRKAIAQPGEKPWFCIFNNTLLEGFIYVSKPAAFSSSTASTSTTAAPTSFPSGSASGSTATATTTASNAYSKSSPTTAAAQSSSVPPWVSSFTADRPQTTAPLFPRHFPVMLDDQNAFSSLSGFPYMVKLEERRLPNNAIKPYCQQYQILDDERANWIPDHAGNPIKIMIDERPPEYTAYQSGTNPSTVNKRDMDANGCHCQWMHGLAS